MYIRILVNIFYLIGIIYILYTIPPFLENLFAVKEETDCGEGDTGSYRCYLLKWHQRNI